MSTWTAPDGTVFEAARVPGAAAPRTWTHRINDVPVSDPDFERRFAEAVQAAEAPHVEALLVRRLPPALEEAVRAVEVALATAPGLHAGVPTLRDLRLALAVALDPAPLRDALRLAKEATNGWACYATRPREHAEIARLHAALDQIAADIE